MLYLSWFFGIVILAKFVLKRRQKKLDEEKKVNEFVEEILDFVENRDYSATHLRDQLIPIDDRTKMVNIWNKALQKIKENETRVVFRQEMMNGEYVEMLSWAMNLNGSVADGLSEFNRNTKKAFSNRWSGAGMNKKPIDKAPQNCCALKIREFYGSEKMVGSEVCRIELKNEIMGQVNLLMRLNGKEGDLEPMHYKKFLIRFKLARFFNFFHHFLNFLFMHFKMVASI